MTLIADYLPLQDAYGGPNHFRLDRDALYEIHVDNDGDAVEDISFQFRFRTNVADIALPIGGKTVAIPLIQAGALGAGNTAALNVKETFTVDVVRGDRRSGRRDAVTDAAGGRDFTKPVDFIGTKTFGSEANYEAYATQYVTAINVPGCGAPGRMFVGQRKDPFVVNLGRTFDLVNLNPLAASGGTDDLADKNVTTLALEVPIACRTAGDEPVIGRTPVSLTLSEGRAYGNAGCNHWFGSYELDGQRLRFSNLGSTRKMCAEEIMEQEHQFLDLLYVGLITNALALRGYRYSPEYATAAHAGR